MKNNDNQFDPINFLGLQSLGPKQKANLRDPLLADMASYIIDSFASGLEEDQLDIFLKNLERAKDNPVAVISLMESSVPNFEDQKIDILKRYREEFKLQKFQNYL